MREVIREQFTTREEDWLKRKVYSLMHINSSQYAVTMMCVKKYFQIV